MSAEVTIERLESPDQLDDVLAIEEASFTNPWTREMYLAELANRDVSFLYVARNASGRIVGCCGVWHIVDEVHINNLAVAPSSRRSGVASALLTHALAEAARRGAKAAMLEVRRSNVAAIRLYERFGFSVTSVRRGYYTQPTEDALILWRSELSGLVS